MINIDAITERFTQLGKSEAELSVFISERREVVKNILTAEITNDPATVGYDGKTSEEVAALLNTQPDVDGVKGTARVNVIFMGVAYANNVVTTEDVEEALA